MQSELAFLFCLKEIKKMEIVCREEDWRAVSPDCELTTAQCRMKIQRTGRNQRPLSGGAIVLRPVKKKTVYLIIDLITGMMTQWTLAAERTKYGLSLSLCL